MNTTRSNPIPVIEAAKTLGVTRSYVTRLLRARKIKGRKITEVVWEVDSVSLEKYRKDHQCN
jgi:hypothetical protein